ncbi:MAG: transporter substrate-binding domain-containing protein [Ruminococcus sp.]|nr:transporter substrate-binding domain-containing protein [Ruminococcus sp.]
MKTLRNTLAFISAAALLAASFTACGSSENSSSEAPSSSSESTVPESSSEAPKESEEESPVDEPEDTGSGDKRVVKIGIGKAYNPFCFLDDNEEPSGYDYETLKAIEPLLADKYDFEFYPDEFANILIGLDTNLYDVAVHHYGWTAERAEKYLYAEEGTMYFGNFVIGYDPSIDTLTDDPESAAGLTIATSKGSMAETLLTNYNDEHPDAQITVEYYEDAEVLASGIKSGLYDGFCASVYDLYVFNSKYGDLLVPSEFTLTSDEYNCGTYFIYSIGDDELKNDIDAAVVQIREDGTLKELSEKWLGGDYTINPNA